ncbi:hypothetical protein, partial [Streptomyces sp. NPDC058398]|uniref:hypothetical protein n=1 Tax=Streptomyces sp. NPDC058398 TaxID=3346479 RepID=UPI00365D9675
MLGGPAPVDADLGGGVLDHHQVQRDRVGGEHRLEAGEQLAEERLDPDGAGGAGGRDRTDGADGPSGADG